jgi:acyl-CoA reductase-like NAD-dependent aldehyde dehydrogenase
VVRDFTMTIGGQGAPATASFDVDNPATGEVIASVPECSAGQLDQAMQSAQDALGGWRADAAARRAAHQDAVPGQPFGGMKWSGTGVEDGRWGLNGFTDLQVVHVRNDA